ncbi:GNAT family N-acetyltransferase [Vibrio sp. DW001]|uniref:GNAT family N-acetyltransferase n=1 Tax=Vibrio sp. DW001 TaxID=2912315 RepID=UPI0023B0BDCB|nr:GNAT family N-acetyltransferase [Vibrio sp. DW001]WED27174.1 GNAT family N-acetyltransferase [Vibrio sp. DW001]
MLIKSTRLSICEFDLSMAESVHLNSLDNDNRIFLPDEVFESIQEARDVLEFLISCYQTKEGPFVYPVLLENGEQIGHVQVVKLDDCWEVGYHIGQSYTKQGYSTEALKVFLPRMMDALGIDNIFGICVAENIASQRVLQKCDFKLIHSGLSDYKGQDKLICKYEFKR